MLPKRAAIQHYWPASSSAHIAGEDVGLFASTSCRSPCMDFLPLPAAFSGSPCGVIAVYPMQTVMRFSRCNRQNGNKKAVTKQTSPAFAFFWKVMLVGYVTAERICKNMLYSIVGIDYHKIEPCQRELVGARPSILLRKTVLSLKSPTGAFHCSLRCANANF